MDRGDSDLAQQIERGRTVPAQDSHAGEMSSRRASSAESQRRSVDRSPRIVAGIPAGESGSTMCRRSGRTTPKAVPRGDRSHLYAAQDTKSKRPASKGNQPTGLRGSTYVSSRARRRPRQSPRAPPGTIRPSADCTALTATRCCAPDEWPRPGDQRDGLDADTTIGVGQEGNRNEGGVLLGGDMRAPSGSAAATGYPLAVRDLVAENRDAIGGSTPAKAGVNCRRARSTIGVVVAGLGSVQSATPRGASSTASRRVEAAVLRYWAVLECKACNVGSKFFLRGSIAQADDFPLGSS